MPYSCNFLVKLILPVLLGISSLASPVLDRALTPAIRGIDDVSSRSANTCADPSLARTIFQAWSGTDTIHTMGFHHSLVNAVTQRGVGAAFWTLQGPVFKAWPTQQPGTVPLFRMITPTSSDVVFRVGADATTFPVVSGFSTSANALLAWVYDSAVCGSVPLMSAAFAGQTDHYYTADPDEHAGLLADGWTDAGVVAFVLPLPTP